VSEAEALAQEAVRALAERFAAHLPLPNRYAYGDRPMREQVLREFKNDSGERAAALTRNSHGCLVLNTARAMFVDVDFPKPKAAVGRFLKRLFGKSEPPSTEAPEAATVSKAEAWIRRHPEWGWRVYRTRAGLRLLAIHDVFEPASLLSDAVFDELGADPLYRRLCRSQKCFRARLTPKPWRCGLERPPSSWPWPDVKSEVEFQEWEARYQRVCEQKSTCRLIATLGPARVHREVQSIVAVHDEMARVEAQLPLA
jgi:hypothetical protein